MCKGKICSLKKIETQVSELFTSIKTKGSFINNIAVTLSGNTAVLIIGFLLTPFIAKIYGPVVYGQFAIFTAICSFIIPISTLQFQAGYVTTQNEKEFSSIIQISFIVLVITSIITLVVSLLLQYFTVIKINGIEFVFIYVFLSGLFTILRGWNIKLQEFKTASQSKILSTIFGKSTTLSYGLFHPSVIGLILGSLATLIIESSGLISKKLFSEFKLVFIHRHTLKYYKKVLNKFRQYPKYVTFNIIINSISTQLPIYFIALYFSEEILGTFSLSLSLIQIPFYLAGTSIGAVFLPKITLMIDDVEKRNKSITKLYNSILYPSIIITVFFAAFFNFFLTPILGSEWHQASILSSFMVISFSFVVIALPVSVVYRLINQEHTNTKLTIIFIFFKITGLFIGVLSNSYMLSIFLYLLSQLTHSVIQILIVYHKFRITYFNIMRDFILVLIIYLIAFNI